MTSSENLCKGTWQIVDNTIYLDIEDARAMVQAYRNKGFRTYIETIGSGFKIVFVNCIGTDQAQRTIHTIRQMLKGTKSSLDIISVD